jgi:hypothetical protein
MQAEFRAKENQDSFLSAMKSEIFGSFIVAVIFMLLYFNSENEQIWNILVYVVSIVAAFIIGRTSGYDGRSYGDAFFAGTFYGVITFIVYIWLAAIFVSPTVDVLSILFVFAFSIILGFAAMAFKKMFKKKENF